MPQRWPHGCPQSQGRTAPNQLQLPTFMSASLSTAPSATPMTVPRRLLATHPTSCSARAWRTVQSLKNTPCTWVVFRGWGGGGGGKGDRGHNCIQRLQTEKAEECGQRSIGDPPCRAPQS